MEPHCDEDDTGDEHEVAVGEDGAHNIGAGVDLLETHEDESVAMVEVGPPQRRDEGEGGRHDQALLPADVLGPGQRGPDGHEGLPQGDEDQGAEALNNVLGVVADGRHPGPQVPQSGDLDEGGGAPDDLAPRRRRRESADHEQRPAHQRTAVVGVAMGLSPTKEPRMRERPTQ